MGRKKAVNVALAWYDKTLLLEFNNNQTCFKRRLVE